VPGMQKLFLVVGSGGPPPPPPPPPPPRLRPHLRLLRRHRPVARPARPSSTSPSMRSLRRR
jgi:hypothetical protein